MNVVCSVCGEPCWAAFRAQESCWGIVHVSYENNDEDVTHYCDGHGLPEDNLPYQPAHQ